MADFKLFCLNRIMMSKYLFAGYMKYTIRKLIIVSIGQYYLHWKIDFSHHFRSIRKVMEKHEFRIIFLHEFKLGHNAIQAAQNINQAWGQGSTSERTVRRWFGKFRAGDESLNDEQGRGRPTAVDDDK
jgi:hypothetical protein